MNRKRFEGESFAKYRESLRREAQAIKNHLRGKYLHVSKRIISIADKNGLPVNVAVKSGTTYVRPKA